MKHGYMSFGLPKNSPFKTYMDRIILKMFATGQYQRAVEKWRVIEQDCAPLFRRGTPLSFEKLISLFFLIGIGVFCALIVLLYEKCSYSETEKAKVIVRREENIANFRTILREVHNCFDNNEMPDSRLLQSLYISSEKIKVE